MSRETQIEEMSSDIAQSGMLDSLSRCRIVAEELYFKGYCKQSEAEWIPIIDEPTPLRECAILSGYECSECGRYEKEKQPYCNCGARMKGD